MNSITPFVSGANATADERCGAENFLQEWERRSTEQIRDTWETLLSFLADNPDLVSWRRFPDPATMTTEQLEEELDRIVSRLNENATRWSSGADEHAEASLMRRSSDLVHELERREEDSTA